MVNATNGVAKLVGDIGILGVVWSRPVAAGQSLLMWCPKPDVAVIATLLATGMKNLQNRFGPLYDRSGACERKHAEHRQSCPLNR